MSSIFKIPMGTNVHFIYGSLETLLAVSISYPHDFFPESVGPPLPFSLVKLIDAPEQKYFVVNGFGKICVKEPNVFSGYYKRKH